MPENNLDTLQIQIFAATDGAKRSIDSLIRDLQRLKGQLSVSSDATAFENHIKSLVSGFDKLSTSISNIDISALKQTNKEVTKLANALASTKGLGKSIYTAEQKKQLDSIREETAEYKKQKKAKLDLLPAKIGVPKSERRELEAVGAWGEVKKSFGKGRLVEGAESAEIYDVAKQLNIDTEQQYSSIIMQIAGQISNLNWHIDKLTAKKKQIVDVAKAAQTASATADSGTTLPLDDNAIATYGQEVETVKNSTQQLTTLGENAGMSINAIADGLSSLSGVSVTYDNFSGVPYLTTLAQGLSATSGEKLNSSLTAIANGLSSILGINTSNSEGIANVANAINRFGYSTTEKAGGNLTAIANGLTELANVNMQGINTENLANLGSAVGKFGSAAAQRAAQSLPQLAEGFRQLMETLSNAPAVSENTIRLAEAMSQMSQRAAGISNATNRVGSGFNLFGRTAHRTRLHIGSLAAVFGTLYANFFMLIRGARLAGKAIDYSSQMTEAMNVVDVAFGKSNGTLKDFISDSIKQFGLGKLAAAQYASRFQAMAKTMGISSEQVVKANEFIGEKVSGNSLVYKNLGNSVADMSINLTKLTADMASLYNQDYDSVAQDMQSVMTGMTRPLRKYGLDLTVASLKAFALKNGLDADIESMTQAEKTMLRYQYVMANASGAMGDFQKTADTWANAMRTVKQLLQEFARILGEAFIQAFKPALLAFRNFMYNVLDLTQKALNAVGKLLGWTKIDFGGASLAEDMEDFADATDGAAGAAKKLKGQLRSIDELNNLTSPGNGGGGGGGNNATLGLIGNDIWENIKETKEKYKSDVKSWYELGLKIAENIENGLKSINWEEIKKNVGAGAKNFASFLNGLFKPSMFKEIGKTVAEGINTGLTAAYEFGKEFDFENFGVSVREGIKGFLEDFDWELLAENINTWVHGFFDFCKGLFGDKQLWKDMFDAAVKLIGTLDLSTLEIIALVPTLIFGSSAVRNMLSGAIMGALGESPLSLPAVAVAIGGGLLIANGINQVGSYASGDMESYNEYQKQNPFTNEDTEFGRFWTEYFQEEFDYWLKDMPRLMGFTDPKTMLVNFFTGGLGSAFNIVKELLGDNYDSLLEQADEFDKEWKEYWETFADFWGNFFKSLFPYKIGQAVQHGIIDILKDLTGSHRNSSSFDNVPDSVKKELGLTDITTFEGLGENIIKGIKKGIDNQLGKTKFGNILKTFFDGICKVFGIQSPAKEMYPIGENIILGIIQGFSLVDFAAKMTEWWNKNVAPWFSVEKWQGIANNIKTAIITKWNETKTQWQISITNWWNNNVAPWFTLEKWRSIADGIRSGIVAKWNELVLWFAGNVGRILDKAKEILSFDNFNKVGEDIRKGIENPFSTAITTMTALWNKLKDLVSGGLSMGVKINADTSGFNSAMEGMATVTEDATNILEGLKTAVDETKKKTSPTSTKKAPGTYTVLKKSAAGMPTFASGGYPSIGSVFVAGETYGQTEWLGDINGRTGVVGGAEISGIRDAIITTSNNEMQILRQQNTLLQGILQKEFGISSDDIFRSVQKSANNYLRMNGTPAF